MPQIVFWFCVSIVLGALRLHGEKSPMFQGIAHIVVGLIFGVALVSTGITYRLGRTMREYYSGGTIDSSLYNSIRPILQKVRRMQLYWIPAVGLTLLECLCFFVLKI